MLHDFSQAPDRTCTNSLKWTQYPDGVIPVWVADTDFQAPEPVLAALRAKLEHGVLGYEFPQKALCETIAARMDTLYGWAVEPEAVVATPGIIAAFNAAAWATCQPGQGFLTQPPVYPPFLGVAANVGLVDQFAQLRFVEQDGTLTYRIDLEVFRAALHSQHARTGMFLLCNPHNPTGQVHSRADLLAMAELCLENEVCIVSDEIHSELLLGGATHIPIASLSKEIERNTITLVAPSKTYNVPGLFCGFAIIPDPALRAKFKSAADRMKLLNLAWDLLGSDFAGRHKQYEKFYAGPSFVMNMYSNSTAPWKSWTAEVDALMSGYDAPQAKTYTNPPIV